jgi:hydroxymethylpyrimidine pyrophosphatase-like HAD family hydrolase
MRSVVFADIDGTLLQSLRAGLGPDHAPAAYDREGRVLGVSSPAQQALWKLLQAAEAVVPVTGRSTAALGRVALPFRSYAIVHHGALVLSPSGAPCEEYGALVAPALGEAHVTLSREAERVIAWIGAQSLPLRVTQQRLGEHTIEVCVKHVRPDARALTPEADPLERRWRELEGCRVHRNGNNLALLPATVTKRASLAWLRQRLASELGPFMALGVGDSLTDLDFMRDCDFYVVPQGSQLDEQVHQAWSARGDLQAGDHDA